MQQIKTNLDKRVETGAVQFDDDWPGVFIRGDNSFYLSMLLTQAIEQLNKSIDDRDQSYIQSTILVSSLESLNDLLKSAHKG